MKGNSSGVMFAKGELRLVLGILMMAALRWRMANRDAKVEHGSVPRAEAERAVLALGACASAEVRTGAGADTARFPRGSALATRSGAGGCQEERGRGSW